MLIILQCKIFHWGMTMSMSSPVLKIEVIGFKLRRQSSFFSSLCLLVRFEVLLVKTYECFRLTCFGLNVIILFLWWRIYLYYSIIQFLSFGSSCRCKCSNLLTLVVTYYLFVMLIPKFNFLFYFVFFSFCN